MKTIDATTEGTGRNPFVRVGDSLYRRGDVIYARVRVDGKRTYVSTKTGDASDARKWLKAWRREDWCLKHGIPLKGKTLHDAGVKVGEVLAEYVKAGCPTRKMQAKAARTVKGEMYCLNPVRGFFGGMTAAGLTLADCDRYFNWRNSGGYVSEHKVRGKTRIWKTRGGKRAVDMELGVLSNALNLAVRRNVLKANPLAGRTRYTSAAEVRHCREVAPTPEGLQRIERWLRARGEDAIADLVCFLAYSGLRIGEALRLTWEDIGFGEKLIHVRREKRGIMPWVPILPEMETLLRAMKTRSTGYLLFPSPLDGTKPREVSAIRHRITAACRKLDIGHVAPHGLRSYFVTQCRQSGLTDAEIAMLIGDKTGPQLIAQVYGDVRPDHLLAQAQRIRLTAAARDAKGDKAADGGNASGGETSRPASRPGAVEVRDDSPDAATVGAVAD
jgi:integrase